MLTSDYNYNSAPTDDFRNTVYSLFCGLFRFSSFFFFFFLTLAIWSRYCNIQINHPAHLIFCLYNVMVPSNYNFFSANHVFPLPVLQPLLVFLIFAVQCRKKLPLQRSNKSQVEKLEVNCGSVFPLEQAVLCDSWHTKDYTQ